MKTLQKSVIIICMTVLLPNTELNKICKKMKNSFSCPKLFISSVTELLKLAMNK